MQKSRAAFLNFIAVLFGFLLLLLLWGAAELIWNYRDGRMAVWWESGCPSKYYEFPGKEGMGLQRESKFSATYEDWSGNTRKITYNMIADNMRRVAGADAHAEASEFVAIFGGSNTFGAGLKDEETIASKLQSTCKDCQVYSFAGLGFGTNTVHSQILHKYPQKMISQRKGKLVYLFIDLHAYRSANHATIMRYTCGQHPHYEWDEGAGGNPKPQFAGYYREKYRIWSRIKTSLARSYLLDNLQLWKESWPYKGFPMACALIKDAARIASKDFESSEFFLVYLDAWNPPETRVKIRADLEQCIAGTSIQFIDVSNTLTQRDQVGPKDAHIGVAAAEKIAITLAENLWKE